MELLNCDSMAYLAKYKGTVDAIITDPSYDADFKDWYPTCRKVCPTGPIIAFCKPENQWPGADEILFWVKPLSTKNFTRKCGRFVEIIMVYRGDWSKFNVLHWSQMTGTYMDLVDEPNPHPFQKPVSLMQRLVKIYTNPGDVVLDCFMGSGSTGVACILNGREFIGIEQTKEYYDVAVDRLSMYSVE